MCVCVLRISSVARDVDDGRGEQQQKNMSLKLSEKSAIWLVLLITIEYSAAGKLQQHKLLEQQEHDAIIFNLGKSSTIIDHI